MANFPRTLAIQDLRGAGDLALGMAFDENWSAAKERHDHVGLSRMIVYEMSRRSSEEVNRLVIRYTRISIAISSLALVIAILGLLRPAPVIVVTPPAASAR